MLLFDPCLIYIHRFRWTRRCNRVINQIPLRSVQAVHELHEFSSVMCKQKVMYSFFRRGLTDIPKGSKMACTSWMCPETSMNSCPISWKDTLRVVPIPFIGNKTFRTGYFVVIGFTCWLPVAILCEKEVTLNRVVITSDNFWSIS